MERVLKELQWKAALVYLDDILVFGSTFEEELSLLEEVLYCFRTVNLKLSPKKCTLFEHEVPFLGHDVVRKDGSTDRLKVTAVAGWLVVLPPWRAPCTSSPERGVRFLWDEACQRAFNALKQALVSAPLLSYLD